MKLALSLAKKGAGFTSPNPMVGAVLVKDGRIVGKGYHRKAGGPHAEIEAIRDAGSLSKGATLFVTLEPCNHTGRTPPCTRAILDAGICHVVSAMEDPNPDVAGGGLKYLENKGVGIRSGVLEKEARILNEAYIKFVRTKKPFVIAKCASTLDGRIAARTGDARWVTGPKARGHVHRLRHAVDAIMVGVGTIKQDDPLLTTRIPGKKRSHTTRIVLDTRLSIPEEARILQHDADSDTLIVIGKEHWNAPEVAAKRNRLQKPNVKTLKAKTVNGRIDLNYLMGRLGALSITSLLIEGGSRMLGSAFASGIVDKVVFFYAPKILGGDDGFPVCRGEGPDRIADSIPLCRIRLRRFGEDIMIEGYMDPSPRIQRATIQYA